MRKGQDVVENRSIVTNDNPDNTILDVGLNSTRSTSPKQQDAVQGEIHQICMTLQAICEES